MGPGRKKLVRRMMILEPQIRGLNVSGGRHEKIITQSLQESHPNTLFNLPRHGKCKRAQSSVKVLLLRGPQVAKKVIWTSGIPETLFRKPHQVLYTVSFVTSQS